MVFHDGIFQFVSAYFIHIDTSPKDIHCQGSPSFSEFHLNLHIFSGDIIVKYINRWMLVAFIVTYSTISSFLSSHIFFEEVFAHSSSNFVNRFIFQMRTYYVDFIQSMCDPCLFASSQCRISSSLDHALEVEHLSMLSATI